MFQKFNRGTTTGTKMTEVGIKF